MKNTFGFHASSIQFYVSDDEKKSEKFPIACKPVKGQDGAKRWYQKQLHREDGPAIERANGSKEWYRNGKLHREDGPAIEDATSTKEWYRDGKRHREDGPAVEYFDGDKEWYRNGKLHRTDGPAVEFADGGKAWWLNGKKLSEDEFSQQMAQKQEEKPTPSKRRSPASKYHR